MTVHCRAVGRHCHRRLIRLVGPFAGAMIQAKCKLSISGSWKISLAWASSMRGLLPHETCLTSGTIQNCLPARLSAGQATALSQIRLAHDPRHLLNTLTSEFGRPKLMESDAGGQGEISCPRRPRECPPATLATALPF